MTQGFLPRSLEELREVLAHHPGARPIAGGTDLMVVHADMRATWPELMDVTRIPELNGVARVSGGWRIGAATPLTAVAVHPEIAARYPLLVEAAHVVGGWQIQNRATLGGNMANASPAGDTLPALLALNASVGLIGASGDRMVPYDDFHTGYRKTVLKPGEVIGWVELPEPGSGSVQRYRKVGTRAAQAISKIVVALAGEFSAGAFTTVRLAAGSVAATPVRLRAAEAVCMEGPLTVERATRAGQAASAEVTPIDDVRSTATYRKEVLGRVVRRLLLSLSPEA